MLQQVDYEFNEYSANQTIESRFTIGYRNFRSTDASDNNLLAPSTNKVGIFTKSYDSSYKDVLFKQLSEASLGSHKRRFLGLPNYGDIGHILAGISFPTNDYYMMYWRKNENTFCGWKLTRCSKFWCLLCC